MSSPNGLSTSPTRLIVSAVLSESNVWLREAKGIVLVGSALSAACYPHLRLLNASLSFSDRCDGWMWLVERFVADGWPTGVGNMFRCFPWLKASGRQNLLLVHPAPF